MKVTRTIRTITTMAAICFLSFAEPFATAAAAETVGCGRAPERGEIPYDFPYACRKFGQKMRLAGWKCQLIFTVGRHQEHSIWEKNGRRKQLMIWRMDTGRTGYLSGEITMDGEKR